MDVEKAKAIIEALLFVSDKPLDIKQITQVLEIEPAIIKQLVARVIKEYKERDGGLEIIEIAGGYEIVTRPEYAPWIKRLFKSQRELRLSRSALETIAIIGYHQPITKAEIEAIRGVNVDGSLRTLLARNLIRIVGRKKLVGRPILYGTTKEFLRCFGLNSLKDLPALNELKDLAYKNNAI